MYIIASKRAQICAPALPVKLKFKTLWLSIFFRCLHQYIVRYPIFNSPHGYEYILYIYIAHHMEWGGIVWVHNIVCVYHKISFFPFILYIHSPETTRLYICKIILDLFTLFFFYLYPYTHILKNGLSLRC